MATPQPPSVHFDEDNGETKLATQQRPSVLKAKNLRGNLMREQVDRDPLFYYEVLSVLGVGSMGSVAKVRKRDQVVGGSARRQVQRHFEREKQIKDCFRLPLVGGLFQYCLKGTLEKSNVLDSSVRSSTRGSGHGSSGHSRTSSILVPNVHDDDEEEESSYQMVYAMKSIHLSRVTDPTFVQELRNEIKILRNLDHPHIVRAIETFEHRNQIFIVMELCSGGDLYSRDPYTEEEAARITSSILSAVSYMHSKHIIHRDLKYENIIFANDSATAEVKLIDFGLSKRFGKDELTDGVGTVYTMAPEVLKGSYTEGADVWSVGVIAFMLLSSQMPFYGRKRKHIVELIMNGSFKFKGRRWKSTSMQAKDFVRDLLVVDPEQRMTADEALGAMWLNKGFSATVRNPHEEEEVAARKSIQKYAKYSKLKRVALMVIAHKSTTDEIGILRKVFQKYDTKRDGVLSVEEFKAALAETTIPASEHSAIFEAVDLDGSGKIRYTEFLASTIEAQGAISEERLAEAFDRIDSDDSGFISVDNLREMLGADFPESEINAIIDEVDIAKDGKISYSEFLAMWEEKNEEKRMEEMNLIEKLVATQSSGFSSERSVSDFSSDHSTDLSTDEAMGRVAFVGQRLHSERKHEILEHAGELKQEEAEPNSKHVGFQDNVVTIP